MVERSGYRNSYFSRILQSVDYINENISLNIDLQAVAAASNFSPYHFHRIFSSVIGETPHDFILRVRLERAANMLVKNISQPVTEIAYSCGFSSSAVFGRAFKKRFGISATQYRHQATKDRVVDESRPDIDWAQLTNNPVWMSLKKDIQIKNLPAYQVIYMANFDGYLFENICASWTRLYNWAAAKNLIDENSQMIGISFDDPLITPENMCRYYACISISGELPVTDAVGMLDIAEGRYAVCHVQCRAENIKDVYHGLYGIWLPDSGLQPADCFSYELYYETPADRVDDYYIMDVCLPVTPLD